MNWKMNSLLHNHAAPESAWRLRLILAAMVLLVFGRLCAADFIVWDDSMMLVSNPRMNPPSLEGLAHYWRVPAHGLYVPVLWTIYSVLSALAYVQVPDPSGTTLNPWVFHLVNVLIHLVTVQVVFGLLLRIFRSPAACLIGAAAFAVHPIQVETVAWVSGTKDLLCWLGAASAVALYVRRLDAVGIAASPTRFWRSWEMPVATLILMLGMLSKPTAMVTPAIVVVLAWLGLSQRFWSAVMCVLPWFVLSLGVAVVARWAQYVYHISHQPLHVRPLIAVDALAFYAGKLLVPTGLNPDYGRTPAVALASSAVWWAWLVPAGVLLAGIATYRRWPWVLVAAILFVIPISPMLGLTPFQMQYYSTVTDHYVYFSMFAVALLMSYALVRYRGVVARGVAMLIVLVWAGLAFVQAGRWDNTFTLLEHTAEMNPASVMATNNLGVAYANLGRASDALPYFKIAAERNPESTLARLNFGAALVNVFEVEAGQIEFEAAMKGYDRTVPAAREELVMAMIRAGRAMLFANQTPAARDWFLRAIQVIPDDPAAVRELERANRILAQRPTTQPAK